MDFIHRFSPRPLSISRVLEEYYKPAKMQRIGRQAKNMGKYWSNPPFRFNPEDVLKKFKYLYLIGREYEIPRLDRQTTVTVRDINNYSNKVNEQMEKESWDDMMAFERDHPGTLALMPGHCIICEKKHLNCSRKNNKPCLEPGNMRFSMEGLGLDADIMAKFELGLLTKWPEDGHLPMRMNCVMGFLSDEYIPVEEFQAYFPDAQKNYINFMTSSGDQIEHRAKRQESWLDNQARQRRELEEIAQSPDSWSGYKSSDMESGAIMQEKPWLKIDTGEEEHHNPTESTAGLPSEHLGLESPHPSLPNEHLGMSQPERQLPTEHLGTHTYEAGLPNEHFHRTKITEFFEDEEYPPAKRDYSYSDNYQKPEPSVFADDPIVPEDTAQEEEDDDSKYKWLGFKRSLDEVEENFYNRPIPKFNVPDEEEEVEIIDAGQSPEAIEKAQSPQVTQESDQLETEKSDLEIILENMSLDELKDLIAQKIIEDRNGTAGENKAESRTESTQEEQESPEIVLPDAASIDNVLGAALSIAREVSAEPKEPEIETQPADWRKYTLNDGE